MNKNYKGDGGKDPTARATGGIEHTLMDGRIPPNRPKTIARNLSIPRKSDESFKA
jgi:hypothetical protein